jgi:hypothetical protein
MRRRLAVAAGVAAGLLALAAVVRGELPGGCHFARTDDIDFARVLPAPPAPGSLAATADLDAVLEVQAWRTPEEAAWARCAAAADLFEFSAVIGPWFNERNLPATAALLNGVDSDLRAAVDASKAVYGRPRPFAADPRVNPCVSRPHGGSYPSGHAIAFFTEAGVLAEVFPEKRTELLEFAQKLAWGRVIGGVHYPTDLAGGRAVAEAILERLRASAPFQAALARSRAEVAAFAPAKAGAYSRPRHSQFGDLWPGFVGRWIPSPAAAPGPAAG